MISATLEEHKPATIEEAKKVLRDAYPFGERAMHPYKIWLDAVKKALHKRYTVNAAIDFGLFDQEHESDDEDGFQPCGNCDLPDACADFGCAIMSGVRNDPGFEGTDN